MVWGAFVVARVLIKPTVVPQNGTLANEDCPISTADYYRIE